MADHRGGPTTTRDPSICNMCWDEWLDKGQAPRKDMPMPMQRRDTWQERLEWRNLGDVSSRLAVVTLRTLCPRHGRERAAAFRGYLDGEGQEPML